jgi:FkbM family methyltransferase
MILIFLRVLRKFGLLKRLNTHVTNANGFLIPIIGEIGLDHLRDEEVWMGIFLRKVSHKFKDKIFLDIGVNIGQTLLKVIFLNKKQNYIGFEPNASCVSYVNELIRVNALSTIAIFPVALSDHTGEINLQFYHDRKTDSSASLVQGFRADKVVYTRKVFTVDANSIHFDDSIGLIKIDVEGAELEALKGLERHLQIDRPLVVCEVLPVYNESNEFRVDRQNEIEKFLKRNKYEIVRINEFGSGSFISCFGIHSNLTDSNYCFYPSEIRQEIEAKLHDS